jgi:hypothetical protein
MARKTFEVKAFIQKVNEELREGTCSPEQREGIIYAAETVLHSTGNYNGFRYLTAREVPAGQLAGINSTDLPYEEMFLNTDRTRVHYYL